MMFKEESFFIFGGSSVGKKKIWNQNGVLIGGIQKSNLIYGRFIKTVYIENKSYILLSGNYNSECFDYDDIIIKTYTNKKQTEKLIVNLFHNNNNIYLISGDRKYICVFDFMTANLIK